ncbi:hypothetical protein HDU67_007815 [Dinochytrium kinnereticum]|nr:hypothetical protein HDU67_007815 [Dinochytrium kinnereticum]
MAKTRVHIKDDMMGLFFRQLQPGRDLCSKSFLAPIQNAVFDFAIQMRNFIYLIGSETDRTAFVVDACWDIDGILRTAKESNIQIVGAIITHHHIDHVGGIPPPPFDKWGVRVDGLAKLLKKLPDIKAYIHPNDIEEVVKANPEIDRDRFYPTKDGEDDGGTETTVHHLHPAQSDITPKPSERDAPHNAATKRFDPVIVRVTISASDVSVSPHPGSHCGIAVRSCEFVSVVHWGHAVHWELWTV